MEGKPIDFDRGALNTGTTIRIFSYFDDSWKAAVVQEIDLAEREILVNYEDGAQEWVGIDGRKICYPPEKNSKASEATKRRASSNKVLKHEPSVKKSKPNPPKSSKKTVPSSSKKSNPSVATKSNAEKKAMSKSSSGSGFLRLKFKSNNTKNVKSNPKVESSKKRKRGEAPLQDNTEDAVEPEPVQPEIRSKKANIKNTQSRSKESKKGANKTKTRLSKSGAKTTSTVERKASSVEKNETLSFASLNEKKIKTLLPKRSVQQELAASKKTPLSKKSAQSELSGSKTPLSKKSVQPELSRKVSSPAASSPEISMNLSTTPLSSVYPTAITTPTLNCSPSSGYVCPKQDCKKQFRKENLLMMHIKHYHPEYRNMLQSMPNVADLAYARTVGEHIGSPQASFLEKIVKLEEDKLNKPEEAEGKLSETLANTKGVTPVQTTEKTTESSKSAVRTSSRRASSSKRLSGSEPASQKLPVLLAQLQGPPLVPPSISIQSDSLDTELSISQKKPSSVMSPQLSERSNSFIDSDDKLDGDEKSPTKKRRLSQLDSTDVINCSCGYGLEDGLMIQCDLCQCWQHGSCVGFENETDVPSNYTCETCQFPKRCHSSRKYSYVQNWLREGVMPSFQFSNRYEERRKKREEYLKTSHAFLCELTELKHAIQSLQVKIQILRQTPDHPKLYLWAKSWNDKMDEEEKDETVLDSGPVPEAAINMADCRKHLSEHIEKEIEKAENMLRNIEEKIEKLEEPNTEDGEEEDDFDKEPEKYTSIAKQTLLMMLRDLSALQTFKYCE